MVTPIGDVVKLGGPPASPRARMMADGSTDLGAALVTLIHAGGQAPRRTRAASRWAMASTSSGVGRATTSISTATSPGFESERARRGSEGSASFAGSAGCALSAPNEGLQTSKGHWAATIVAETGGDGVGSGGYRAASRLRAFTTHSRDKAAG
jgi:hypothetical protein